MANNINKQGVWSSGMINELYEGNVKIWDKINPNLMKNSREMGLGTSNINTGTWRYAGTNSMTRSRVQILDSPIGTCYGFQNSGQQTHTSDSSCYGMDNFPRIKGKIYTASFWARTTDGNITAQAGFAFMNVTYINGTNTKKWADYYMTVINRDWTLCTYTFTSTAMSGNIYIGVGTDGANTTIQICGFKMEEGSIATPWIPNEADYNEFNSFNANSVITADSFYEI